jgi:hypothetical protein
MPRMVDVTLGERVHTIAQLRTRQSQGWRKDLVSGPLGDMVRQMITVLDWREVDMNNADQLKRLVDSAGSLLLEAMDAVAEAVIDYAPALKDAVDEAYDDELVTAFWEVIKLAFPFEMVMRLIREASGSKTPPTSPNSASASGGDGTTS